MTSIFSFLKPPFRGLLLLLLVYFLLCFVLHPRSSVMQGRFIDPDDTMYAVEAVELLDGQAWYDRTEHRMDSPTGVPLHFTRLLEVPYAATIGVLSPIVGRSSAVFLMASVWPPIFLIALLLVYRQQARLFLPKKWIGLTAFVGILAQRLLFDFMPGHIDHHGVALVFINISFAGILFMLAKPEKTKPAFMAGLMLGVALFIALETLPWVIAFTSFIGIWALIKPQYTKAAVIYVTGLALSGLVLLPTVRPPSDLFIIDITSFSIVYVFLLIGIAVSFGVLWVLRHWPDRKLRIATGVIFTVITATFYLCAFPQLLQGPYGAVDKKLIDFLLPNIKESTSLWSCTGLYELLTCHLPWPVLSLGICIWQMRQRTFRFISMWALIAIMQVMAMMLTVFYETRFLPYMQMFGVIPLTFLLWKVTRHAKPFYAALYVVLALVYPIGSMFLVYKTSAVDAVLYPMISYTPNCDISAAAQILNRPPYHTGEPKLIMNQMDQGPDLLLHTPHSVLSAPFHENIAGNLDVMNFFRADNAMIAQDIIRRRKADFVLLCRYVDRGYILADPLDPNTALPHPFVQSLIKGDIPDWLSPIELGKESDILLYRVIEK